MKKPIDKKLTAKPAIELHNDDGDAEFEKLNKVGQAAVVLLSLGEETAGEVIKDFSRHEFERIAYAMSKISGIKSTQAKNIISDFFLDFKRHSGIRGANKHFLNNMLVSALGGNIGKGLVADLYGDEIREKMQRLQWIPSDMLFKNIQPEHRKMQCAFLAYLPPETASEILEHFDEESRIQLLHEVSRVEGLEANVADDLLKLIEQCAIEYTSNKGASIKGSKHVANIINRYGGDRNELIRDLRTRDPLVYQEIEEQMFDFYLLVNQNEKTFNVLHEHIELEQWATALKGIEQPVKEVIFNSLSRRQKNELIDIMEELGSLPISVVKNMRTDILSKIRELSQSGDIDLMLYKENVVD